MTRTEENKWKFPPPCLLPFRRHPISWLITWREHTNDDVLTVIAPRDYGIGVNEIMEELRPIRDSGIVPFPLTWRLREAIALTIYSNPDMPNQPPFEPGPSGRSGHQARLFACSILLRAEAEIDDDDGYMEADSALGKCLD